MKKLMTALALSFVIGFTMTTVGVAQKGKGNSDVPVTALVHNADPDVAPSLQIQSDGAAYATSSTVKSNITATGVWALDLRDSARRVSIEFSDPVSGSGPNGGDPVAPASGLYDAWLYSSCNHFGNNPVTMVQGQTVSCPMAVVFLANGKDYILHMNGNGQPETDPVNFTCLSGSSGNSTCGQWHIRPSGTFVAPDGTPGLRNVARLSYRTTSRGQTIVTPQGNFYLSFSIVLTK